LRKIIDKPGLHSIPAEEYHADPAPVPSLSSSVGKVLLSETASHAWTCHPRLNPDFVPEEAAKFDRGKACHGLVLGDPQRFKIIDAADWRTKAAQEARNAARLEGMIPLLTHQMEDARAMHQAFVQQIAAHRDSADIFTDGKPEQMLLWQENVRGTVIWCRGLLDWLPNNRTKPFGDYKTLAANVNPDNLNRYAFNAGWDFQDAFYRRGLQALEVAEDPHFKFVVQQAEAPYSVVVVDFPPEVKAYADGKVDEAIDYWAWCMKKNVWPGYPGYTCTLEMPPWIGSEFEARKVRRANDPDLYEKGLAFQAPLSR